jgi:hypothetical protein
LEEVAITKSVSNWISYLRNFFRFFPHCLAIFLVWKTNFGFISSYRHSVRYKTRTDNDCLQAIVASPTASRCTMSSSPHRRSLLRSRAYRRQPSWSTIVFPIAKLPSSTVYSSTSESLLCVVSTPIAGYLTHLIFHEQDSPEPLTSPESASPCCLAV